MSLSVTYPGVYVEELPSSVHTITGVATSITAFIGRAARGPTDLAVSISSFGDFNTQFGGLWANGSMGFAVRDFFLNGGTQAVIVRVYNADPGSGTAPAPTMLITVGNLSFQAASQGTWGVNLRVVTDQNNITNAIAAMVGPGLTAADLFNLTVTDMGTGAVEKYANLTVKNSPARVDLVLAANSALLAWQPSVTLPTTITIGQDSLSTLQATLATAQAKLLADQIAGNTGKIAADQTAVADAQAALNNTINAYMGLSTMTGVTPVSDGLALTMGNFNLDDSKGSTGIHALDSVEIFNMLCIPPYLNDSPSFPPYPPAPVNPDVDPTLVGEAAAYCESRRAVLIVDAPAMWDSSATAVTQFNNTSTDYVGTRSNYAAIYYPRLIQQNPLQNNQYQVFAACGAIAGMIAQTDGQRGVWKAPAGQETALVNAPSLAVSVNNDDSGSLNPLGVNCLRSFSAFGRVIWGARTLAGSDQLADQYKYLPVRRTALYIESSLYQGLQWAVFEPNDDALWAQIRLNVTAFMQTLFIQGAFSGTTPASSYFVKCDSETTTATDQAQGIVNVVVGFAPVNPAEFVVIQIQQITGQSAS